MHPKIFFGGTSLNEIFTWVDASYTVHHYMKSKTGGVMSMILGETHFILSKQKLNAKISTESELVGASYYVPYNAWWGIFMRHKGYLNKSNNFLQDNQIAMSM